MSERLIIFTVPPAATLREQDAADLEMLRAALKWREGAGLTGPDDFGPLSDERWHVVLQRVISKSVGTNTNRETAELEYLVKLLERDGTRKPETERRWADILRRFIREDYEVPTGRPKQEVRDRQLSRHYWLLRRVFADLSQDDCAEAVGLAYADAGGRLSASRIKRIAMTAPNSSAAQQWIDDQVRAFADHAPDVVGRALLATFEPLASDRKLLAGLFWQEVK